MTLAQHGPDRRLIVPASIGDEVTALTGLSSTLRIDGEMAETVTPEEHARLQDAVSLLGGLNLHINKVVPSLDAGASLAAAILRAGARLMGDKPVPSAAKLGPDVAAAALIKGPRVEGGVLSPVMLPRMPVVLVDAGHARLPKDEIDGNTDLAIEDCETFDDAIDQLRSVRNNYEPRLRAALPELDEILDELMLAPGCALVRTVGHTSVVAALFPDEATAHGAASLMAQRYPAWWVAAATLS